jgi:predicted phosphodiesterase
MMKWIRKLKRRIAIVGDTHVGSEFAVFPEGYINREGRPIDVNPTQRAIRKYWDKFWDMADFWKVDSVIHLGDALEGLNVKERGAMLVFADIDEQIDACVQLLRPCLVGKDGKRRTFTIISGSGYHGSSDVKVHKKIAENLGGTFGGDILRGTVKGTNKTYTALHGAGDRPQYAATMMAKEAIGNLISSATDQLEFSDIILHGHYHIWAHWDDGFQHVVLVPAWQAYRPVKVFQKQYFWRQPHIGGVILLVDENDRFVPLHYLMPNLKRLGPQRIAI